MSEVSDAPARAESHEAANRTTGSFIWYELLTSDLMGAKTFYDAVVGWTIADKSDFPNDYRMIERSDGGFAGGAMQLTDEMRQHGARPTWLAYLYSDDVDGQAADIERDGGKILLAPFDIPGVGRVAMVADPSGVPFYIMKPTPPAGDPDAQSDVFSVDQPQHVRWNELATSDQDGAIAFYGKHFGFIQEGAMPMGEMGDYKFIYIGPTRVGAVMRKPPQLPVSMWSFYIGVDDIDRAAEAVKEAAGKSCTVRWKFQAVNIRSAEWTPKARHSGWSARASNRRRSWPTSSSPACGSTKAKPARLLNFTRLYSPTAMWAGALRRLRFPGGKQGEELTVEFTVLGQAFVGLNGGPNFKPNEAVSFMVLTENQEETDRYWNAITRMAARRALAAGARTSGAFPGRSPRARLLELTSAPGERGKRAFQAMMTMKKIDIATIEAAGGDVDA